MTVLNKNLTLITVSSSQGRSELVDILRKKVRASVNQPGINLAMRAEYVGQRIDLLAFVRRSDYSLSFNYAEYKGIRYRIESANPTDKELFVRLVLIRN